MKKFAKIILLAMISLSICVSLCSCESGLEGASLSSVHGCIARFDDGTLYLDVLGDNQTYSYELKGDNTIIIEDEITYTYEIDGDKVVFDDDFMGVSETWWK